MEAVVAQVRICEAEVYRSGCTITMRGTVQLAEGANRLVVRSLPSSIEEGSESLRMPAGVQQGQVRLEAGSLHPDEADRAADDELNRAIEELDRTITNKQLELDTWKSRASQMQGPAAIELLDRLPEKLDQLTRELADLNARRLELSVQRKGVRERLGRPCLVADLVVGQAGTMPIEVTLRSHDAGWSPAYDVLADPSSEQLSLRMKAEVWQRSGDDWQDVTLRLSTGSTVVLGELPRFATRHLSKEAPRPVARMTAGAAALPTRNLKAAAAAAPASEPMAFAMDSPAEPLVEVSAPGAEVREQATAITYELPAAQSVAGSGETQVLYVATTDLPARYYHYAYPRRLEAAYLVARLESQPPAEMFEQPVSVYLDGSYAGSVRVSRSDEDAFELALGTDDLVCVRRTEDVRRSKSLLGGKVTREHSSKIVVDNHRKSAITMVVLEQVPVSRDKEIEVSVRDVSGATHDADRGELRWEREMAAGAHLELSVAYSVVHPKGVTVYEEERAPLGSWTVSHTFCHECGAPTVAGERFCHICGALL